MNYEEVLVEIEKRGMMPVEVPLQVHDGLIAGSMIGIRQDIPTSTEKAQVACEELAHGILNAGDIIDQDEMANRKQEKKARRLAHQLKGVNLEGIVSCYNAGCRNIYEMAEHLECTEEFLKEALVNYREIYGRYAAWKEYTIFFEPCLAVMRCPIRIDVRAK